jgi:5-hydroxyisourate hydrolase-like protein (transthyretin family)
VRGTLWPPAGEPLFAVGTRHVVLQRASEIVAETETDRRGRFELRADKDGTYAVVFSESAYAAAADVKLGGCYSSQKLDLFVKRR